MRKEVLVQARRCALGGDSPRLHSQFCPSNACAAFTRRSHSSTTGTRSLVSRGHTCHGNHERVPRQVTPVRSAHSRTRSSQRGNEAPISQPPRPKVGAVLGHDRQIYQVYGANTGVGKTIVSTALLGYHASQGKETRYIKPVSTGADDEADVNHIQLFSPSTPTQGLLTFDIPTSPHLAAPISGVPDATNDSKLIGRLYTALSGPTATDSLTIVEGAGGVMSPGPSGTVQADLYRPLRLPVILVADHRLGGISSTISAWESLHVRGYDVDAMVVFDDMVYENHSYLQKYFKDQVKVIVLPTPPVRQDDRGLDQFAMQKYYKHAHRQPGMRILHETLRERFQKRHSNLSTMSQRAVDSVWHPFMQHTERHADKLTIIDSAYGDKFQVYSPPAMDSTNTLASVFDGSASWWTQGLGHGNPKLALTAAHAAGRYGHVMFANAAHEPAVSLAERLISTQDHIGTPVKHKYSKCFFSDNGSTGMEVAVKMALRAAANRYNWSPSDKIQVLGLKGSYHGDTIGVMDCSEQNVYNEKVEWYSPRGQWLDFPLVKMQEGKWKVIPPKDAEDVWGTTQEYDTIDEIFDLSSRTETGRRYAAGLDKILQDMVDGGTKFGALIMEPVILGAGGMLFADPLFQHELYNATQRLTQRTASNVPDTSSTHEKSDDWSGMPVIADEVFTGLYRLNRLRSSDLIAIRPDIVVNAKLLTGGLLPLATTLASESIFKSFLSNNKADALLHGHSYTAHAVGCEVALESLSTLAKLSAMRRKRSSELRRSDVAVGTDSTYTVWSTGVLDTLSRQPDVESVAALGTVLILELRDAEGAGYTSTAAAGLRDKLFEQNDPKNVRVHCRVLGNVLYFMAAPSITRMATIEVERAILTAFGVSRWQPSSSDAEQVHEELADSPVDV